MFARAAAASAVVARSGARVVGRVAPLARAAAPSRAASGGASGSSGSAVGQVVSAVFRSNQLYITYLVAGCIVLETVYGSVTDAAWASMNRGRTYETVDWSKFKTDDE